MRADRRAIVVRLAPVALLAALAIAWLVPEPPGLRLAPEATDGDPAREWEATLDGLSGTPLVLLAFDPDLGTYPEIRPTVRAAIADLLYRNARIAFVSLTPEGRALGLAELDRLERGRANPARLLDLGFVPGAEAAIVELARGPLVPEAATGEIARRLRDGGVGALDAVVVVGGNDIGPRSWVEQLLPRVGAITMLAVAPTALLPELLPYRTSGQLDALLATPIEGAAYRDAVRLERLDRLTDPTEPRSLPIAIGLVVALGVIGHALVRRTGSGPRAEADAP